ncbi:hypothetical protein QJS10_CPB12g00796 [Acorus calamus]|uniref:Uncharacterized protein n=1 Tax=Acorus calamus TaxID=4465 RepID=A0AAV9DP50_ACOCL|nr:hypothetical protein QJS10_CPB12g00796 [Acorus calamus]
MYDLAYDKAVEMLQKNLVVLWVIDDQLLVFENMTRKAPKIFNGMCFHFRSYFLPDFKYLEELTLAAGGTIVKRNEMPAMNDTNAKQDSLKNFFVYYLDPPEGCNLTEVADVIQKRMKKQRYLGLNPEIKSSVTLGFWTQLLLVSFSQLTVNVFFM